MSRVSRRGLEEPVLQTNRSELAEVTGGTSNILKIDAVEEDENEEEYQRELGAYNDFPIARCSGRGKSQGFVLPRN